LVNNTNVIPNIIQGQDNIEIPPQAPPIVQTQHPQEVSFRRSTRERRNGTLDYYGAFL